MFFSDLENNFLITYALGMKITPDPTNQYRLCDIRGIVKYVTFFSPLYLPIYFARVKPYCADQPHQTGSTQHPLVDWKSFNFIIWAHKKKCFGTFIKIFV